MRKILGIIGGAGVAATNKLNELIEIEITKNGAKRDYDHPEIIIWQATKAPSRSMFLEGNGESFVNNYIEIAEKLKAAGAKKLCMSCNTAHFAIEEIEQKSGIAFINLVKEVVLLVQKSGKTKIGLIASDGCLKGKVYEKYFSEYFPLAELIYPDENNQKKVTKGICGIKNASRFLPKNHNERPFTIFNNVCKHLDEMGAEAIIIGCTDIRTDFQTKDYYVIDSLETLAKCIIMEYL